MLAADRYPYTPSQTRDTVLWFTVFFGYLGWRWWRAREAARKDAARRESQAKYSNRR